MSHKVPIDRDGVTPRNDAQKSVTAPPRAADNAGHAGSGLTVASRTGVFDGKHGKLYRYGDTIPGDALSTTDTNRLLRKGILSRG